MLIFSPQKMKFIWYLPKKVNFLFILYSIENKENLTLCLFSLDYTFSVFIGYNIGCKLCLHLENGFELYSDE